MALLKASDAEAVRRRFRDELAGDVTIRFFTASTTGLVVPGWEAEYGPLTQQLLEEVAALDPRLRLEVHSITAGLDPAGPPAVERVPAITLSRDGGEGRAGIRFFGIPSGFEFAALIDDLIAVSRNDSGLAAETKAALAGLTGDIHIQVFVTPTCPYCPRASRLAHAMALESSHVRADVIESMEFPSLADRYGVRGVPKIVINETGGFEGALPEPAFLEHVLAAAAAERARQSTAPAAR
ncbi:MAG TPA: thioredoxin family protein [bacterium]|nr:thioredoxin family protein [bacterium]